MPDISNNAILTSIVQPGASKVPSASWRPEVYHPKEEFEKEPEWKAIEKIVKARDKHNCQSCGVKIGLTVHHILPRSEGGQDHPPNLITLCQFCHNEIESLSFRDRYQIMDYKRNKKYIKGKKEMPSRLDWHKWVYGGYSKP